MMQMVYTRIVVNMHSGELIGAQMDVYSGSIAQCKGGPSTTVNSVDYTYNAGMLALSREQQSWARKYTNLFEYGVPYDPNETVSGAWINGQWVDQADLSTRRVSTGGTGVSSTKVFGAKIPSGALQTIKDEKTGTVLYDAGGGRWLPLETARRGDIEGYDPDAQISEMELMLRNIEAQAELLPYSTALTRAQAEADLQLVPEQTSLALAQLTAERGLVPRRTALEETSLADAATALEQHGRAREAFITEALSGTDVAESQDLAQAEVEHAFALTQRDFERGLVSAGARPGDTNYINALNQRTLERTKGIAGARTQAKTLAENTLFEKLKAATALTGS